MISGDLSVFPLLSVLQMLLVSGRGGVFTVDHPRGGELWFEHGEVLHARSDALSGEAALQLLASVDGGTFTFEPGATPPERTLHLKQDAALHWLLREADAWVPLLQVLPDWDRALQFTDRWTDQQPVTREQYLLLSRVAPATSLRTLVERSGLPPRSAAGLYAPFVSGGLLDLG